MFDEHKLLWWLKMKRVLILVLFIFLYVNACARETQYATPVHGSSRKLVVIPRDYKEPTLRPYMVDGVRYFPLPASEGFVQFGRASWYGKEFHGRPTSSGKLYDMYKKSAAHKTLPLGTYVRVLNLDNKKEIVVEIRDRGPFVKGRIIDLSYAAAKEIGLIGPGVSRVKVVALGKEVGELKSPLGSEPVVEFKDLNRGEFTVQVGAFSNKENALIIGERLKVIFSYVEVAVYKDVVKGTTYRVRVSRSKSLDTARQIQKRLEGMGFEGAFVVSF